MLLAADGYAQEGILKRYDLAATSAHQVSLPDELEEISGLAAAPDGNVYAHNDERGILYKIDPQTGKIVSRFSLGKKDIKADFEGIASAKGKIYLATSGGELLEFLEAPNSGRALYNKYETGLKPSNDIEGLCYDPVTNELLVACKGKAGAGFEGERVKGVYAFSLTTGKLIAKPRFVIDMSQFKGKLRSTDIRPSSIERHPVSGTFFLLASQGAAIIELSPEGKVIGATNLPRSIHSQPEGLTFLADGTMVIANEGDGEEGSLVLYPLR